MAFANQRDVDRLKPGDKERFEFDLRCTGLSVRLHPGGKPVYTVWYTSPTGKRKRITLGSTAGIRLDVARQQATEILAAVRSGRDPGLERQQARAKAAGALPLGEMLARYRDAHCKPRMRPQTLLAADRYIARWKPLHSLPCAAVARRDVSAVLLDLQTDVGPALANRVRACLHSAFVWAMQAGLVDHNPVIGAVRAGESSRDRVLDEAELRALWEATNDNFAASAENLSPFHRIVRLLMLTGARRSEVGGMAWEELDLPRALWTIPASRMKGNAEHQVPLSRQAMEGLPDIGHGYVFGITAPYCDWARQKRALDARLDEMRKSAEFVRPWRLHDIRRSVVSHMNELGIAEPHIVEACIGHKVTGVAKIYNRARHLAARRKALQGWADWLAP